LIVRRTQRDLGFGKVCRTRAEPSQKLGVIPAKAGIEG
jgi:hypothetical protein